MTITVAHRVGRDDLALGLVRVEGITCGPAPQALAQELEQWTRRRRESPLSPVEEARVKAGRDTLRNGRYKPTGRAKPACEYLLRTAAEGEFPRINGPVDANNLVSIIHCVSISVWDLELAASAAFEFRLGSEGEQYIFNSADQSIDLCDLVCGCALADGGSLPIVTPVKDSQKTKLKDTSTHLGGAIYFPLAAGGLGAAREATELLLAWLLRLGPGATGAAAVLEAGQSTTL